MLADQGVDELLLATLRVTLLERYDGDAVSLGEEFLSALRSVTHDAYSVGLIILNAYERAWRIGSLHDDRAANHDLHRLDTHERIVAREVRLTLDGVDDNVVSTLTRRRRELDMRREGRTTHTDDTHLSDAIDDLLGIQIGLRDERVCLVNVVLPLVALDLNKDGGLLKATGVSDLVDLGNGTRDGGVDICRDKASRLA